MGKETDCFGCGTAQYSCSSMLKLKTNQIEDKICCPCSDCLIKTMCDTPCNLFKKFQHAVNIWKTERSS